MRERARITAETAVEEVVREYPRTVPIFYSYGLPVLTCGEPLWGTIAENAAKYGLADLGGLLRDLNRLVSEAPAR